MIPTLAVGSLMTNLNWEHFITLNVIFIELLTFLYFLFVPHSDYLHIDRELVLHEVFEMVDIN